MLGFFSLLFPFAALFPRALKKKTTKRNVTISAYMQSGAHERAIDAECESDVDVPNAYDAQRCRVECMSAHKQGRGSVSDCHRGWGC